LGETLPMRFGAMSTRQKTRSLRTPTRTIPSCGQWPLADQGDERRRRPGNV